VILHGNVFLLNEDVLMLRLFQLLELQDHEAMIETAKIVLNWLNEHHIQVELLNLGGGFGINTNFRNVIV
jgi:diaminopimelate decarboxylase